MKVCVVGLGYIGLPTAIVLASVGVPVAGFEIDPVRRRSIAIGVSPFQEADLEVALRKALDSGAFTLPNEVEPADTYIVAVPTPLKNNYSADLSYLETAISDISEKLVGGELVIIESTCPPGTTEQVQKMIYDSRPDLLSEEEDRHVHIAYCPERVLPGSIWREITENDRIVGGLSPQAGQRAAEVYATFCSGQINITDSKTAELTKLAENAFRDVNIAFANELETISRSFDVDVWRVIELANRHPRVNILQPGPGVGGHCIAVDPWFLIQTNSQSKIIRAGREVNISKPREVAERVKAKLGDKTPDDILALGVTFKENVEDVRESPAAETVKLIAQTYPDAQVTVVDPLAKGLPDSLVGYSNLEFARQVSVRRNYDVVIALVAHDEFLGLTADDFPDAVIVDTRGMLKR